MVLEIADEVLYYPEKSLLFRPVIDGAKMWSVALNKTMLTYFEIEPNRVFEKHAHVNEQITMVLKGELYFELEGKFITVRKGEVIAIPSGVPHAAFTKKKSVTAVDAWSPVMKKYLRKADHALETEARLSFCPGMKA